MQTKLLFLLVLLLPFSGWAQTPLVTENFDSDGDGIRGATGVRYTSNQFRNATNQYFERTDSYPTSFGGTLTGLQGTGFWASESVSGTGSAGSAHVPGYVELKSIPTSGKTNLRIVVAMASPRGETSAGTAGRRLIDKTDVVTAEYSFNNGTSWSVAGRLMGDEFRGTGSGGDWRQDANLDGSAVDDRSAGSLYLKQAFQDFTFPIPSTGSNLLVRIVVDTQGPLETEMAFDNIRVFGDASTVATPTLTMDNTERNSVVAYTEGGAPVQLTNTLVPANPASGRTTVLTKAVVTAAGTGWVSGQDNLTYSAFTGISYSYNSTDGTLTLTGTGTGGTAPISTFQSALRSIQYNNSNTTNATAGNRTFSFVVYDNPSGTDIPSNAESRTVQVSTVLNNPAGLPYTDDFESDGEGTRYASTAYTNGSNLGFFLTNAAAPTKPFPLGGSGSLYSPSTFSGYNGSIYWFSTTTGAPANPTRPTSSLITAPVNATGFHDLHFLLKMGQGTNSQGWETTDYVKLSYRLSSTSAWVDFASFYGLGTTGQIRQDTNNDGVADAAGLQINAPLKDFDFTLPPALTGGSISFKIEFRADNTDEEFAFDHLRVTGFDNYAPTDIALSPSTVAENQPAGTVVGTFSSTDPDNPAQGQTFTYTLVSGANSTDNASFTIGTGANAGRLLTASAFNFEAKSSYSIRVRTTDNGSTPLFFEESFTITVTNVNEAPVIAIQTFSLAENSATNTVVGTVAASDPDAGQTLTYAITAGNTGGAFAINSSSGQLTVANPAALNFEVTPSFALIVQVTDNGSPASSAAATVTVNLTNVNEAPVIAPQTFSIAENVANNTVVGTVVASDPDAGNTLTYSITAGNTNGAFAINATTGQLRVANPAALNFEVTPTFALTVNVSDGALTGTATVTVNLTNVPNATYLSSTAEQNTRGVLAGATDQVILRIPVVLDGSVDEPLSATAFTFSTAGTTVPANVAAARLYYTGTSGAFATTTLFGSVTAPGAGGTISGSQVLQPNTNYFWLVYDVAATAATGNLLDATLSAITVGGVSRTPAVTAPVGARTVITTSKVAGSALRLNGTNTGYVDLGTNNPNLLLGSSFTMEVWVKPVGGTGTTTVGILGNDISARERSPYIGLSPSGKVEVGYVNVNGDLINFATAGFSGASVVAGQWNQLVVTFTPFSSTDGLMSLYINGTNVTGISGGLFPMNVPVRYVGQTNPSATGFVNVDIDEVALWNRPLNQDEIRLRRHLVLSGGESNLTSYLQFNEASGNALDPISGASGTFTGTGISRVASTVPISTGVSALQSVSSSGNFSFGSTGVAINFTGSGSYTVGVARLDGRPQGTQPSGLVRYYNEAYWIINKYDGGTFSNAAVTYSLRSGTLTAADAASPTTTLRLLKRDSKSDGTFDAPIAATAASLAQNTVTFNVTSFSQTVIGTLGTSPLPVELVNFTAERRDDAGLLRWATASEKNSAYFAVESSPNGRDFRELGQVQAQGTSSQAHEYQFVDAQLTRYGVKTVYYRLRQVDQDGTVAYSPVRTLSLPTVTGPAQLLAYPNPAHDKVQVILTNATTIAPLELFDAVGRLVRSQPVSASEIEMALPLSGLPAGVYVLRCGPLSQRLNVE